MAKKMIDTLLPIIAYFFLGHSNMSGYCAEMDTVKQARVCTYNEQRGFYQCDDRDIAGHFGNSGSMVLPFLKRMALLYPDYNFCGIKYGHACGQAFHVYTEDGHKGFIRKRIADLKGKATIGGVIFWYGYIEGQSKQEVDSITRSFERLSAFFRAEVGDTALPVIICKYEKNGLDTGGAAPYRKWKDELQANIETAYWTIPNCAMAPIRYVPAYAYCDNHHYNKIGYEILGVDCASVIQIYKFDFWSKQ
jgi:hypothetical protein